MKFAYMIKGGHFCSERDRSSICDGNIQIIGVPSVDAACKEAAKLRSEGVECIELCGAFGPEGAMRVIEAVENSIPVGFATHLPIQDEIFKRVFGE